MPGLCMYSLEVRAALQRKSDLGKNIDINGYIKRRGNKLLQRVKNYFKGRDQ
jgi:hypothetical protein